MLKNTQQCVASTNNLIRTNERSIRIVSGDNESNFENSLERNNKITLHQKDFQVRMTEVYKTIHRYAPPVIDNFFMFRENTCNFRNFEIIWL